MRAEQARFVEEQERLARERREAEEKRQEAERERLAMEERARRAEQERQAAELQAQRDELARLKAEADKEEAVRLARVQAEEEARARAERERVAAEEREIADRERQKRLEGLRPDREKLVAYALAIRESVLAAPEVKSDEACQAVVDARSWLMRAVEVLEDFAADSAVAPSRLVGAARGADAT